MKTQTYRAFLLHRLLLRNDFGSEEALLEAIETANALEEQEEWRARKAAFNAIAEKAPLRPDTPFVVLHADIPEFLKREAEEFQVFQQLHRDRR